MIFLCKVSIFHSKRQRISYHFGLFVFLPLFRLSQGGDDGEVERVVVGAILEGVGVSLGAVVSLSHAADLLLTVVAEGQFAAQHVDHLKGALVAVLSGAGAVRSVEYMMRARSST